MPGALSVERFREAFGRRRMLTDPRYAASTVSAIAPAAGFGDLSHFNRNFRRRYGATPSEVRAAGAAERAAAGRRGSRGRFHS